MSNRKKLKTHDGATRIVLEETKVFTGLYKVQVYSKASDSWNDLEGCDGLTWKKAAIARKNYVGLRDACKVANGASLHINVPANEVHGN